MAISGGDGSIILTTKVDTKGLDAAMAKMRQQAKGTGSAFESLSNFIKIQETRLAALRQQYASYVLKNEEGSVAAKKLASDIKNLSTSLTQNQARLNAASASAVSFGAKAKAAIAGVGASLKVLASYLIGIQTIFAAINFSKQAGEFAIQTEASVQRLVDIYGESAQSVGDFIDENARAIGMSKASASSFASVYGNLFSVWADQSTNAELTNKYLNMTAVVASKTGRTVQDVQERIRSGLLGNTEAIEDLGVFVNVKTIEMTDAFQRMADGKSWEQLDAYTQQQVRTMAILEQATAKYGNTVADTTATTRAQYQAAYEDFQNTWGQVVNTVLIPVLKVLTQVFTIATKGLQILAGLSGKTVNNSKLQENAIGGAVENQNALTDAVKETEKAQKSLTAGFDELNIISQENASASSGTGTTNGANVSDLGIGDLGGTLDGSSYVEEISSTLMAIMGIVALAMVAVGLILLFTGHIGWGIGFIIAGAGLLAVTMASASEFGYDGIINMLTTIMGIAGGALLALGIILLWIGGVVGKGVAIGMIIAGAALIVGAVATKAAFSPEDVGGWLSLIMGIAGGALLALGIILCMVGIVPLGVGMIIAGAIGLVSAVALNFDSVKNSITGWVAVIMAIAGAALLVLGIILCATGAALPLGIALIMAGAVALVTPIALNWNAIVDWIKGAWNAVKQFWNTYIAPIFTAKWWADLGKKAINGLLGVIEKGLNWIIDKINEFVGGLSKIVGKVGDVIGVDWSIPKIPKVKIPRLAQGAVIPPNREFLAVLGDQKHGTNIETPLDTMIQAFKTALADGGYGGETSVNFTIELDSDTLYKGVKKAENKRAGINISNPAFAR
jgi:hypothetical protein